MIISVVFIDIFKFLERVSAAACNGEQSGIVSCYAGNFYVPRGISGRLCGKDYGDYDGCNSDTGGL